MTRTAFVTGATGLLGSNLVAALVRGGYNVRALVRSPAKARDQIEAAGVELAKGDMTDVASFARSLEGVDIVFHTAAYFRDHYKGGRHWNELVRVNVDGTRALLEQSYAAGVRRFVHTSSVAVVQGREPDEPIDETMRREADGEQDDYYRSKILSDRVVDAFLRDHDDFFATFVLPGFMNGPRDAGPTSAGQFILDFAHGRLPGILDSAFSYVDARDVAAAEIAAEVHGRRGERYLVAGRTVKISEAMALLAEITGLPGPRRRLPMLLVGVVALANEIWSRLSGKPVLLGWSGFKTMRRESRFMTFDSSKAKRELGIEFRPLRDTFEDAVRWFDARGSLPRAAQGR